MEIIICFAACCTSVLVTYYNKIIVFNGMAYSFELFYA